MKPHLILFSLMFTFLIMLPQRVSSSPRYQQVKASSFVQRDGLGNLFQKIKQKDEIRIAYFGGSITAAKGWRVQTTQWFKSQFPHSKIHEINAAIGGTGSGLGVFRLKRDVLKYHPDLVFIEFAVNDGGRKPQDIWKSMEGIVRQIWIDNPRTEICFVYTFRVGYETDLRKGKCPPAASAMEMLAEHYQIPSINVALKIANLESAKNLIFQSKTPSTKTTIHFSKDGVHPSQAGHKIYTGVIVDALQSMQNSSKPVNHRSKLNQQFVSDHWQNAKMIPLKKEYLSGHWQKIPKENLLAKRFNGRMGTLWQADQPSSQISFKFKGSQVGLYDLVGPDGGQVVITVDGVTQKKLRPRFDSYCISYRIATLRIAGNLDPDKVHTVSVKIHPDQPDRKSVSFRLKDPVKELKSPKYQGTNFWVGQIMIRGDIVK